MPPISPIQPPSPSMCASSRTIARLRPVHGMTLTPARRRSTRVWASSTEGVPSVAANACPWLTMVLSVSVITYFMREKRWAMSSGTRAGSVGNVGSDSPGMMLLSSGAARRHARLPKESGASPMGKTPRTSYFLAAESPALLASVRSTARRKISPSVSHGTKRSPSC